jgi:hypothetical protein
MNPNPRLSLILATLTYGRGVLPFLRIPINLPGMKMVFDVARLAVRQPRGWALCLALALAATAGCSKSSPPQAVAPPSSDSTSAQQNPSPAPAPLQNPGPVVAAGPDDTQTMMQGLNRALMGWMIRNHRHPKTFEEFASSANMQIPDPPAGKKYTLNAKGFIVLVDN